MKLTSRRKLEFGRACGPVLACAGLALLSAGCVAVDAERAGARTAEAKPSVPAAASAPAAERSDPASQAVKKAPLVTTVQLDAVVEAVAAHPVRIAPKAWADFTVLHAVAHGTRVSAGDVLVRLDAEKIADQIRDLDQDRPLAASALEIAEAELKNLAQSTPQKLQAAERAQRNAANDFEYFEEKGRAMRENNARMSLRRSEQTLANAREELKQLEKMYEADDLTEETEEIILKRQQFEVQFAEHALANNRTTSERELTVLIPREHENLKTQQTDQSFALAFARESLPKALSKKELDVDKMKREQAKGAKRLAELKADLESMTVRAPAAGIVFYGACENGKWTTAAAAAKKLIPGGKIAPFEVFMTVVDPARLQLRAVTPEAELGKLQLDWKGDAAPVAHPARRFPVTLAHFDPVPLPSGGFDTTFAVSDAAAAALLPGMNCKVSLTRRSPAAALLIPLEGVFWEDGAAVVYCARSGGGHERRAVKLGNSNGKHIEALDGLREGDRVLTKRPE